MELRRGKDKESRVGREKEGRKEGRKGLGSDGGLEKRGGAKAPLPSLFSNFFGWLRRRRRGPFQEEEELYNGGEGERRFVQFHGRRRRGKEEKALSLRLCQGRPNSSSFLWRRLRLNLIGLLLPLLLTRRKEKGGARLVFLLRRFETIGAGEFNGP